MMKWFLIFSLIFVFSCGNHSSQALSADQQGLFNLSRDYKNDYKDTSDSKGRENVMVEYELKLQDYSRRSCSYRLENMHVQLKKFEEDAKGRVFAQFVDRNNEYVFQKRYDSSTEMRSDTIYRLVKSFQLDTDITVRFLFAGNVKVNEPGTASSSSFQIEVTPTARG